MFEVDKKIVSEQILNVVQPTLDANGFKRKTGLGITYRRDSNLRIDVIEFEIYSPSQCRDWKIPPYSFTVNVGCLYKFIPSFSDDRLEESPQSYPHEYECHFRMKVKKNIWQWRCADKSIWCVRKNGKNIVRVVKDIDRLICKDVLPWFMQYESVENVYIDLNASKNENNKYKKFSKKYSNGFGVSLQIAAFLALQLNKTDEAKLLAKEALSSRLFEENYPRVLYVKNRLEQIIAESHK